MAFCNGAQIMALALFTPAFRICLALCAAAALLLAPATAKARENLGLYSGWAAFRDPLVPRCYAIAKAEPSSLRRDQQPYATVGTWPRRNIRNQIHFRLSRTLAAQPRIAIQIGGERFSLMGSGSDAWADDGRTNAAIIARMRSARSMTVSATGANGTRFSNTWQLAGAASAMDAASLGCARLR